MLCALASLVLAITPAPPRFDGSGRSVGPPASARVASYVLEARLDPVQRRVAGAARLTWVNRSDLPQRTLWFHAYWNAFKNAASTFAREEARSGGGRSGPGDFGRDDWGWIELRSARLPDGSDVASSLRWERPDDGNPEDQTVFTLTLPAAVPPGGSVTIDLGWEARVPRLAARSGVHKGYFLLGQWFPKVGVLEVPPERGAKHPRWNCHQFHATTEFYADFGTYDAALTVPRSMVVEATGVRTGRTENADGTVTHRFHQDDVVDFAWTAWDGAVEVQDVFRSDGLPEVALTAVVPPDAPGTAAQILAAARATLEFGGRHWLPYPYPHLTLVAPPLGADFNSGGMEYPAFVTVFSRTDPILPRDTLLWEVTVHEVGHGWFQGLLASNEFEEAWLDEGIDTWATEQVLEALPLRWNLADLAPPGTRWLLRPFLRSSVAERDLRGRPVTPRHESPVVLPGWRFKGFRDLARATYGRGAHVLRMLQREVGPETFDRVMRTYVERWAFHHPGTDDFLDVASEVSGRDLRPLGNALLRGTAGLDDAVAEIRCDALGSPPGPGLFGGEGGPPVFREKPRSRTEARCEVLVERHGDLPLPLEVAVIFEDGSVVREQVPPGEVWHRFVYRRPLPKGEVRMAEVHPGAVPSVDSNTLNDARSRRGTPHPVAALGGWMLYAAQLLAAAVGSLL